MPTAAEMKVTRLYSYQSFKPDFLKDIVVNNRLYLSNPKGFNDPWDCRPFFSVDVNDPKIVQSHLDYFVKVHEMNFPEEKERRTHMTERVKADPAFMHEIVGHSSVEISEGIDEHYRVRCFSTRPDCSLMWGHYAEKHQGICLEFDTKNDVFCATHQVEYQEEYPPFLITDDSVDENIRVLTTKSHVWSYEHEYRLIALDKTYPFIDKVSLVTENNLLPIPSNALKSIIVGCMASKETILSIKKIIEDSGKEISLKRAARFLNKFGLALQDIP